MSSFKKQGYDHLLKLIIIGDSSVGKTCLLLRFSEDSFPVSHMPTIGNTLLSIESVILYEFVIIGIDFKIKKISVDEKRVKL